MATTCTATDTDTDTPHRPNDPPRKGAKHSPIRDFLRALPVVAVTLIACLLYVVYVWLHCVPLLQANVPVELRESATRTRGIVELVIFHILAALFVSSYVLTIITPAGSIPNTPEWQYPPVEILQQQPLASLPSSSKQPIPRHAPTAAEFKVSGGLRHCKWCRKIKPDRAHHCRVCRQCVLRMDHHCPWVYNCIGYANHKYFLLLVMYSVITLAFFVATQVESITRAIEEPMVGFGTLLLLLFSEPLALLLMVVVSVFLAFHLWLVYYEMSTIEFCEKRHRRQGENKKFDRGCWQNAFTSFGSNPCCWLLPIDDRKGDGLSFELPQATERVALDVESARPLLVADEDCQPIRSEES